MANAWLRLWHDMPNDPKWRTIARVSGQPIATVMAVYIHLLVSASRNVTRGHIDVTTEDLASALDVTEEVIDSILQTMQGRVLDGDLITGWEKRQVLKEDNGNIISTYNPSPNSPFLAYQVSKMPNEDGSSRIFIKPFCDNMFGCQPNPYQAVVSFKNFVKTGQ